MFIVFEQDGNKFTITPATTELPLVEIARKDVPNGCPFVIVENPSDADLSKPDGVGIGGHLWQIERNEEIIALAERAIEEANQRIASLMAEISE